MNRPSRPLRILLVALLITGLLGATAFLLYLTEGVLHTWALLGAYPAPVRWLFAAALGAIGLLGGYLVWHLLAPPPPRPKVASPASTPSEAELEARLVQAQAAGIEVHEALAEFDRHRARRATGTLHIALFGEISTGKSSLVAALLPQAEVVVGPRGGTTREVRHYRWESPAGDALILTDLPGLNEAGGTLDEASRHEALRAHIVVYLVDGDLTREQYTALGQLQALHKPIILALNKVDLYRPEELQALRQRLEQRVSGSDRVDLVTLSSGGEEEVLKVYPDGREEWLTRQRPPRLDALARAIQWRIDSDAAALDQLRDSSVFTLIARQIDTAEQRHRQTQGESLVRRYTRRAMLGAMAAVSPGTDLLIQGYLGYKMLDELCQLHGVELRRIDGDRLIDEARGQVGKSLPLLLAVAGNALKAFPGLGTLTGGLAHAVAYGLIFDSLGKAVARTLEGRGELVPGPATRLFKETLSDDLETRTRSLARLALDTWRERGRDAD